MKVSVVIANWNYERFLEAAIQCVLNQDYGNIELILVDDGSVDSSRDIMARYKAQAIVLFKTNGGQASALNYAFPYCTGEIVLFLDADDLLRKDAISKIAAGWRPGISKTHFPLEVIDENARPLGARIPRARLSGGQLRQEVLEQGSYMSPPSSGNAYCRKFLQSVMPIPERDWVYADAYLICLAPLWGEIGLIDELLGQYRRHERSATNVSAADPGELQRKLGVMLEVDKQMRRLLELNAERLGLALSPTAIHGHWLHLKSRLALSRLSRQDRSEIVRLTGLLLRAVWASRDVSLKGRLQFTAWAILVAILPLPVATPLIRMAFSPGDRGPHQLLQGWHLFKSSLKLALSGRASRSSA